MSVLRFIHFLIRYFRVENENCLAVSVVSISLFCVVFQEVLLLFYICFQFRSESVYM